MITIIFEAPGVSVEKYDEICSGANVSATSIPDGLISHTCAVTDDGFIVIDVWESAEKFEAFGARLIPAMEAAGVNGLEPRIYPTHSVFGTFRVPVAT